jgi:cobalt-zinc-cadmium efflux system outer membrane protein
MDMFRLRALVAIALVASLQACALPLQSRIDREIENLGVRDVDVEAPKAVDPLPPNEPPASAKRVSPPAPPAASQIDPQANQPRQKRLTIPEALPGADAPPIHLPQSQAERKATIREMYPPVSPLGPEPALAPGPEGKPLTLEALQRLGEEYSPNVKTAIAAVEMTKGNAYQAGMYPNPTFAYEHDVVQTGTNGYPGFYVDQLVKTGGKLQLQQAAAVMDVLNAKLALKRARSDLRYAVRSNYFAVLVATENVRVSEALFQFTQEIYRVQVELLETGGLAAGYEPMQLRPLVVQAKYNLLQARNQFAASWRQLAAAVGLSKMHPSELAGRVDLPIPRFDYEKIVAGLDGHTDVQTAVNTIQKSRYLLQLARATPIPDVDVRVLVQKDYTTPPFQIAHSAQFAVQAPLWDQNKGGIHQARWQLSQSAVGPEAAKNALVNTLADAFNRYQTSRRQVEIASEQIRDQVRAYRGAYERRQTLPGDVGFGDLVTAQQTLASYVGNYIAALGLQWQAVVDVANVQQGEDLFQVVQKYDMTPIPKLSMVPTPVVVPPSRREQRAKSFPDVMGEPAPSAWGSSNAKPGAPPAPERANNR